MQKWFQAMFEIADMSKQSEASRLVYDHYREKLDSLRRHHTGVG
jgi:hypothetical protein